MSDDVTAVGRLVAWKAARKDRRWKLEDTLRNGVFVTLDQLDPEGFHSIGGKGKTIAAAVADALAAWSEA